MKKRAFIYIVIAGILWGTSSIFVHFLAPFGFSSPQMTFVRGFVTTISLSIYILIKDKSLFKAKFKEFLLFALGGLSFFSTATCYYASMQMTSVSTAVVLMYIAPVLVMIYSVALLGEKLTPLKSISVLIMLIGCVLVSGVIGGLKFDFWGIIIGIMSGISYAAYNVITKYQMRNGSNPLTATFYCFAVSSLVGVFVCDAFAMPKLIAQSSYLTIPLLLGLGICTCVLPYFLYTLSLKELPVGTVASLGIIEPMSATVLSVLFLNEVLSFTSAIGIVLILGAVFMLSKSKE
ncbi:MAG: EamA family transporter [Clostridia bacterium]|nr:EamA family transporter [Clostridia bacterium]